MKTRVNYWYWCLKEWCVYLPWQKLLYCFCIHAPGDEIRNMIMTIVVPLLLFIWFIAAFIWDGNSYKNLRNTYDKHFQKRPCRPSIIKKKQNRLKNQLAKNNGFFETKTIELAAGWTRKRFNGFTFIYTIVNKTALYAVMIALLVPLISYFIVKTKSESAIHMPRHYFPDSVVTDTRKGKRLLIQYGIKPVILTWPIKMVRLFLGIAWKENHHSRFFFTRCPTICPGMTMNMKRLEESIHNGKRVGDKTNKLVHFLSFSIDPERDSVERLKYWANRFQIDPENGGCLPVIRKLFTILRWMK